MVIQFVVGEAKATQKKWGTRAQVGDRFVSGQLR